MNTILNRSTVAVLATVTAISGASAALSHDQRKGPGMDFEALDLDGDGVITMAEIDSFREARFVRFDANEDGFLDQDEVIGRFSELGRGDRRRGRRGSDDDSTKWAHFIERFDEDGDGKLSLAELPARRLDRVFNRLDSDDEGTVTRAEFDAAGDRFRGRMWRRKDG